MARNYYRGLIVALLVVFSVKLAQSDSFFNQVQGHRDLDREIRGYNYVSGEGFESVHMSPRIAMDPEGPISSSSASGGDLHTKIKTLKFDLENDRPPRGVVLVRSTS